MAPVKSSLSPILPAASSDLSTSFNFMSDKSATNDLRGEAGGAALEKTVGKSVVDSLRRKFTSSGKMQRGDFYMAQSLELLQRIFPMICPLDKERLWATYTRLVQTTQA
jgi:hypothetical protein